MPKKKLAGKSGFPAGNCTSPVKYNAIPQKFFDPGQ
jgi:hypothetical protein